MHVTFRAIEEFQPAAKWAALFQRLWPAYEAWFLKEGDGARPGYLTCVAALREHMPELLPTYERLVDLAGGGDRAARFLSLYCPTPFLTGCSQAVWTRDHPLLIRNYDYSPKLWEGVLLHTAWNGTRVMAMSDCLWGVLDGLNEHGLCVSLSFGGSKAVGVGFGMPLVLRYVLEFCQQVAQAVAVLQRVPTHMTYNVTLLDRSGASATVFTGPDRAAEVVQRAYATNHQHEIEWPQYVGATGSLERERLLANQFGIPGAPLANAVEHLLQPPFFFAPGHNGWCTLYTAIYEPLPSTATLRWRQQSTQHSFTTFGEQDLQLSLTTPG
jgi:hypothetical protein